MIIIVNYLQATNPTQELHEHGVEMQGPVRDLMNGSTKWSSNHQRNMLRKCRKFGEAGLHII